ncbi:MAG: DNA polymerase/3'-5' exonuclease PolX, partial [Patescibacteria group bacterium]|nr:DNA polymerase/3'-5' exonuclease PolX [Patescibacteria group bacterium]
MLIYNIDISKLLKQMADLLEIKGANRFRVRAYRNAARNIETLNQDVRDLIKTEKDLTEIPGVGKDIAAKMMQIVETGKLKQLQELQQELPAGLLQLLAIEGLGPKRVKQLYEELNVTNWQELKVAAQEERIQRLDGFGPKIEKKILQRVKKKSAQEIRTLFYEAERVTEPLLAYLKKLKSVKRLAVAGSYRRKKETVGDIDILVASNKGAKICEKFAKYEDVERVISQGKTRSSVVFRTGLQVDLRVVKQDSFGAAMQYFTGSRSHNIKLRRIAIDHNFKLNEYGLFERTKNEKKIAGADEEKIYQLLDMKWIPPELRESRGEIEAAQQDKLPNLIKLEQIRGDLQMHTKASDGINTAEEMMEAARDLGYEYIAITDHSQNLKVAHGLDKKRYRDQFKIIDELNKKYSNFQILKSAEVDILKDGKLDLDEEVLAEFDLIVCSIHSHFNLSEKEQTERVVKAMQSPYFHIFGHPTGRLINRREPYQLDMEKVLKTARANNCIMEINAQPSRLDLSAKQARMAKEMGVKISFGTDAHQVN